MKNKAKCKLCNSIIESFHATDYVTCSCGEISLDGGNSLRCFANDLFNIIRIDDEGNEIIPKVVDKVDTTLTQHNPDTDLDRKIPTKNDLIDMLDEMIKNLENLPQVAMSMPVTHYDLLSSLLLVSAIFRAF